MTKRFLLFIAAGEPDGKTPLVKRGPLATVALQRTVKLLRTPARWTAPPLQPLHPGQDRAERLHKRNRRMDLAPIGSPTSCSHGTT